MRGKFIAVGENIHCTRIRLMSGKFVETADDGTCALVFEEGGEKRYVPVPEQYKSGDDFKTGKVKHVAAAIWQGFYGEGDARDSAVKYLQKMALEQEAKGAHFLDLNVDEFSTDQAEKIDVLRWAAGVIQDVSSVPMSIDSSNEEILEAGLEVCDRAKGKPLLNSLSLERVSSIKVAVKAGAKVIAGATGEKQMPEDLQERISNIAELMKMLKAEGLEDDDIYLDPLVLPVSVNSANGIMLVEAVRKLRQEYGPDIHFAPGLSNISFGLPKRNIINKVFTWLCFSEGCDGGIVDTLHINDTVLESMDTGSEEFILTKNLIMGEDEYGMEYIGAVREGRI